MKNLENAERDRLWPFVQTEKIMIVLEIILMGTLICFACLNLALICTSVGKSLVTWWNSELTLKQQWIRLKDRWSESPGWRLFIVIAVGAAYGYSFLYHLRFIIG
jgi:hypothetical protein